MRTALEDRFWSKVDVGNAEQCWEWTAYKTPTGYGRIFIHGRPKVVMGSAHRVSYELHIGPIPDDMEIDHTCFNPGCVNPAHLEVVSHFENMRRSQLAGRTAASRVRGARHPRRQKTHCPHGHPYAGDNLYIIPGTTVRRCKQCHHIAYMRKRAAA